MVVKRRRCGINARIDRELAELRENLLKKNKLTSLTEVDRKIILPKLKRKGDIKIIEEIKW